jgi:hypothetical protein
MKIKEFNIISITTTPSNKFLTQLGNHNDTLLENLLLATDLETGIRYNQLLLFNTFHHQIIQKINLPKK